jgi:ATP-dependent RecD-like DNA helicase SH3 domain/UvrD-like helicase C-terminal domain
MLPLSRTMSVGSWRGWCHEGLGARSLNIELQKELNPPGEIHIERFGWTFCPGDKVMQVENDYDKDVYNGDLGVVSRVHMEEGELVADFDGREVTYGFGELDELVLAYATTIHKSQGSQYPAVVIPLSSALPDAAAESRLYGGDARQAPRGACWAAEGAGDRHQGRADAKAVVEALGMADWQC